MAKLALFALSDQAFGKDLFRMGRERDDGKRAVGLEIGEGYLAGEARAHVLGDGCDVLGIGRGLGDPLKNCRQIADRHALA